LHQKVVPLVQKCDMTHLQHLVMVWHRDVLKDPSGFSPVTRSPRKPAAVNLVLEAEVLLMTRSIPHKGTVRHCTCPAATSCLLLLLLLLLLMLLMQLLLQANMDAFQCCIVPV
jgi:hypothetical protein